MFVFVRPAWVFVIVFVFSCARVSEFVFVCVCVFARVSIFIVVFLGVIVGGGPARRVNARDAPPIVQSRPARKGNKQTQNDKRKTITQKRNPMEFFLSTVSPAKPCAQVRSAQHVRLEIPAGI